MCLLENLGSNRGELVLTFYVRQLRLAKVKFRFPASFEAMADEQIEMSVFLPCSFVSSSLGLARSDSLLRSRAAFLSS